MQTYSYVVMFNETNRGEHLHSQNELIHNKTKEEKKVMEKNKKKKELERISPHLIFPITFFSLHKDKTNSTRKDFFR